MAIESIPPVNRSFVKFNDKNIKPRTKCATSSLHLDSDVKQGIDHATGLLQTIVTDKISDKVLRKLPSDEYLHLLGLLDEIINGSIDRRI